MVQVDCILVITAVVTRPGNTSDEQNADFEVTRQERVELLLGR